MNQQDSGEAAARLREFGAAVVAVREEAEEALRRWGVDPGSYGLARVAQPSSADGSRRGLRPATYGEHPLDVALEHVAARKGQAEEAAALLDRWRAAVNDLWAEAVRVGLPERLTRVWLGRPEGRRLRRGIDVGTLQAEAVWYLRRPCASWHPDGGAPLSVWVRGPVLAGLSRAAKAAHCPVDANRSTFLESVGLDALEHDGDDEDEAPA